MTTEERDQRIESPRLSNYAETDSRDWAPRWRRRAVFGDKELVLYDLSVDTRGECSCLRSPYVANEYIVTLFHSGEERPCERCGRINRFTLSAECEDRYRGDSEADALAAFYEAEAALLAADPLQADMDACSACTEAQACDAHYLARKFS